MRKMKKTLYTVALTVMLAIAGNGCSKSEQPQPTPSIPPQNSVVTGLSNITLSANSLDLVLGNTEKIVATIDTEEEGMEWYSENPTIASVGEDGTITANALGTTRVVASLNEYVKAFCTVNVVTFVKDSYYIHLDKAATQVYVGDEFDIGARLVCGARELDSRAVIWESSNDLIATVDYLGRVTAHSFGAVTITAKYLLDDVEEAISTCFVNVVSDYSMAITNVETIANVLPGESFTLSAVVFDSNGELLSVDSSEITFRSANESLVRCEDGKFYAMQSGRVRVYASYGGVEAFCDVDVWGLDATDFVNIDLANSYGIKDVLNKGFIYEGYASGQNYVALSSSKWQEFLDMAETNGYTKVTMRIYAIDGKVELRPYNLNNSLFVVPNDTFLDENACSYDSPYTTTMSITECRKLSGLMIGMLADGSFEFTITPEK